MKKILTILLLTSIIFFSGCSSSFYLKHTIPSCGEEYNSAFDLALKEKDLSFCIDKKIVPDTVIFDNGIITKDVCKNSKGNVIDINDESCVGEFVEYHNQPELCIIFDKQLFESISKNDKLIISNYLKNDSFPSLSGFIFNCIKINDYTKSKNFNNSVASCILVNEITKQKENDLGIDLYYNDKEICIQKILGCNYEFESSAIKYECNKLNLDNESFEVKLN